MQDNLTRLVYVSSASGELSETELQNILTTSRKNNEQKNVTGLLLYSGGNILQVLEGDKEVLQKLYLVILGDHRHYGVIKMQEAAVEQRVFSNWSMGFKTVTPAEFALVRGYLDINSKDIKELNTAEGSLADILQMFLEHNR